MSAKKIESFAIAHALDYERAQGRQPVDVTKNRDHIGYDIYSAPRKIEVKGVGESWKTYTWQALYATEYAALNADPENFFLYIVKFTTTRAEQIEAFYIIPGTALKKEESIFTLKIETYALRPISQGKLSPYKVG